MWLRHKLFILLLIPILVITIAEAWAYSYFQVQEQQTQDDVVRYATALQHTRRVEQDLTSQAEAMQLAFLDMGSNETIYIQLEQTHRMVLQTDLSLLKQIAAPSSIQSLVVNFENELESLDARSRDIYEDIESWNGSVQQQEGIRQKIQQEYLPITNRLLSQLYAIRGQLLIEQTNTLQNHHVPFFTFLYAVRSIFLVLFLLLVFAAFHLTITPVERVTEALDKISLGNLNTRLVISGDDEVQKLVHVGERIVSSLKLMVKKR